MKGGEMGQISLKTVVKEFRFVDEEFLLLEIIKDIFK
jgi:hypothetical protein